MMTNKKTMENISRVVSHALRHEPWLYELELDDEGWVSIDILLAVLKQAHPEWASINEQTLAEMISSSDKQRHEIKKGFIRALYGHSTPNKLLKQPATPPEILYHGTSPETALLIQQDGLQPMGRQYVHLSVDKETAMQVGRRKSDKPTLLSISTLNAVNDGVLFYRGNDTVWLADEIPARFISLVK